MLVKFAALTLAASFSVGADRSRSGPTIGIGAIEILLPPTFVIHGVSPGEKSTYLTATNAYDASGNLRAVAIHFDLEIEAPKISIPDNFILKSCALDSSGIMIRDYAAPDESKHIPGRLAVINDGDTVVTYLGHGDGLIDLALTTVVGEFDFSYFRSGNIEDCLLHHREWLGDESSR